LVPATVDNFVRAETDRAFAGEIKAHNSLGKFAHRRETIALSDQVVPRVNRDTLYSTAVFDSGAEDPGCKDQPFTHRAPTRQVGVAEFFPKDTSPQRD
jgi:hypothetical protein